MALVDELARKAKDLTQDMRSRLKRDPDVADYRAAFERIITKPGESPTDAVNRWIKSTRK